MRFITTTAIVVSLVSSSFASTVGVVSRCNQNLYLLVSNSTVAGAPIALAPNGTYSQPLVGSGNQFGVAKDSDYYATTTAKFTFGFSVATDSHLTYWSIGTVNGDPFAGTIGGSGFLVAPSDSTCSIANTFDGQVHTCTDAVRQLDLAVFDRD